jgi:hypothetical protein
MTTVLADLKLKAERFVKRIVIWRDRATIPAETHQHGETNVRAEDRLVQTAKEQMSGPDSPSRLGFTPRCLFTTNGGNPKS